MDVKYPVVVVHGIGGGDSKTKAGWSRLLRETVLSSQTEEEKTKHWVEAPWEGVNDNLDTQIRAIVGDICKAMKKEKEERLKAETLTKWQRFLAGFSCMILPYVGNKIPEALDFALDLPLYIGEPRGNKIRQIVLNKINETSDCVLVGHSLGSLICFDILSEAMRINKPLPVRAMVTFGSPLQWIEEMRKEEDISHVISEINIPWTNLYYPADPICRYKLLDEELFRGVRNIELKNPAGGSGIKGGLKSHTAYWNDSCVAEHIRNYCF